MKPLKLIMKGFKGTQRHKNPDLELDLTQVPDDARLVALVGPNGAGKTTILDNLHPYRLMPSRSTTLTTGGFNIWDWIGPEALKELCWEHNNTQYKSLMTFSLRGKTKKAEYYLFEWCAAKNDWIPAEINGVKSDGKAASYDSCIVGILGEPEAFFTAHFAAQNRKGLSDYQDADVKSLLASILNLNHLRDLSSKASMVAKLLNVHLDSLQDELAEARSAEKGLEETRAMLAVCEQSVTHALEAEKREEEVLVNARQALSRLEVKKSNQAEVSKQRDFLQEQVSRHTEQLNAGKKSLTDQLTWKETQIQREVSRLNAEMTVATKSLTDSTRELGMLEKVLAMENEIISAEAQHPTVITRIRETEKEMTEGTSELESKLPVRQQVQKLMQQQVEIKVKGQAKAEEVRVATELESLIAKVPCRGSAEQATCHLMRNANEAQARLPVLREEYANLRKAYADVEAQISALKGDVERCDALEKHIAATQKSLQELVKQEAALAMMISRKGQVDEVKRRREQLNQVVSAANTTKSEIQQQVTALDAERQKFTQETAAAVSALESKAAVEIQSLKDKLASLETPVTEEEMQQTRKVVERASAEVEAKKAKTIACREERVKALARIDALQSILEKNRAVRESATKIEDEIACWKRIEKGLGNNGLVALSIDDSGPEISSICNQLLTECYDSRFTIRIETQKATTAGTHRETFDVLVFDSESGAETPLGGLSGGEKVWINECLTRAIALFVSRSGQEKYLTLFTDEADGQLDADRKRQFMDMKRYILQVGGYEREYFISQTPELWMMADYVIDVGQF